MSQKDTNTHISKTPMQYTEIFKATKIEKHQENMSVRCIPP